LFSDNPVSLVLIDTIKQFNAAGYSTTGQRGEVKPSQASKQSTRKTRITAPSQ
jgi:hypothetical protein